MDKTQIDKNSKILITGGSGFLGSYLVKELRRKGYRKLIIPRSKDYDLRQADNCKKILKQTDVVIHLAAMIGGIGFNRLYPADMFYNNLIIGLNILHQSHLAKVKKIVAIGTVCAYPKYAPVPFREENFWDGYPESTNAPYGLAKKMLLVGAQAYRQQYNLNAIYLIPVNLYGPGDNFSPRQSHVIPALIRKFYHAKIKRQPTVMLWGSGNPTREFLYVTDAARGIVLAMEKYNKADPVNLGIGKDIRIYELAEKIREIIGYSGKIIWDKTKPDGQPRRLLNTELAWKEFGFRANVDFDKGLKQTINWYLKYYAKRIR